MVTTPLTNPQTEDELGIALKLGQLQDSKGNAANVSSVVSLVNYPGTTLQAGWFGDSYGHLEVVDRSPTYVNGTTNTGAATVTLTVNSSALPGTWTITMLSSTTWKLQDPTGTTVLTNQAISVAVDTTPRTLTVTVSSGGVTNDTFIVTVAPYSFYGISQRSTLFWANVSLGYPYQLVAQCGVSSDTMAMQLARIGAGGPADPLLFPNVSLWFWQSPAINDQGALTSLSSLQNTAINVIAGLKTYNAKVVVCSNPIATSFNDNSDGSVQKRNISAQFENWLAQYCQTIPGVYFFNQKRSITDPATGIFISGYSGDGIHKNYLAGANASQDLANILKVITPGCDTTDTNIFNTFSLYGNGQLTGTTAATTSVNTVGSIATAGITSTNQADTVSLYVRATGTATATKTALTGKYIDIGQTLTITTTAARDGAGMRFNGDGIVALGRYDVPHVTNTAINKGQKYIPSGASTNTAFAGLVAQYTIAGTTSGTEPTYPTRIGTTFTDGTATGIMVPMVGPGIWRANYNMAVGTIFFTTTNSTTYFQVTVAGQTSASVAAGYATALLGQTVTDNTLQAIAITPPTYAYKSQADYTLTGFAAGKGIGIYHSLQALDVTVSSLDISGNHVAGPFYDLSGSESPPAQYLPASGQIQTPIVYFKPFKQCRYLIQDILVNGDAGMSGIAFTAYRPMITQVSPALPV